MAGLESEFGGSGIVFEWGAQGRALGFGLGFEGGVEGRRAYQ